VKACQGSRYLNQCQDLYHADKNTLQRFYEHLLLLSYYLKTSEKVELLNRNFLLVKTPLFPDNVF